MRFKEWFLYSRYREEIPKILLLPLLCDCFRASVDDSCLLFLYLVGPYPEIGRVLVTGVMIFDFGWQVIYVLAFWTRDSKVFQITPAGSKRSAACRPNGESEALLLEKKKELSAVTSFGKIRTHPFVE